MRGASIGIFIILVVIGATVSGCLGSGDNAAKEKSTGTPAQIADAHVKERMLGGYEIVGPKDAPGVKLTTPSQKPEKAILDDGVIDTGDMDDISLALSDDGKIVSIYANEAAFKNNGGDILFSIDVKGVPDITITKDEFTSVASKLYRYDVDIQKLKTKYNLPKNTVVNVESPDTGSEFTAASARGGYARAQFVID